MDDKWRLGHTKVFFRAGAMGCVEEVREESIKAILFHIQAMGRRWVHSDGYRKLCFKKEMIPIMQRNMKKYLFFRDWTWYFLVNGTKRFIGQVQNANVMRIMRVGVCISLLLMMIHLPPNSLS